MIFVVAGQGCLNFLSANYLILVNVSKVQLRGDCNVFIGLLLLLLFKCSCILLICTFPNTELLVWLLFDDALDPFTLKAFAHQVNGVSSSEDDFVIDRRQKLGFSNPEKVSRARRVYLSIKLELSQWFQRLFQVIQFDTLLTILESDIDKQTTNVSNPIDPEHKRGWQYV